MTRYEDGNSSNKKVIFLKKIKIYLASNVILND